MKAEGIAFKEEKSGAIVIGTNPGFQNGVLRVKGSNWDGTQTAPTLTQNNANGGQRMPDKQNFNAVIGGVQTWKL